MARTKWRTRGRGSTARHFPIRGGTGRSRLTYQERQKLPPSAFAIPEEEKYPVPTVEQLREAGVPNPEKAAETHARNALARVSADGTESEKHRVCRLVSKRHPEIHSQFCEMHGGRKSDPPKRKQIFRTFDDASARNAQAELRKARIPFNVTRSKTGSFDMIEFHTAPRDENRAFRIIDEEVNAR
jgi:hypothetical protein